MIHYADIILKNIKKGILPKRVFVKFDNAFRSLDLTKDLALFDIKILKDAEARKTYRLRKGKYRALFYITDDDFFVFKIDKREEVYKK